LVFRGIRQLDVVEVHILGVTDKEPVGRHGAEPVGFRVFLFKTRHRAGGHFLRAAALEVEVDVAQVQPFDRVTRIAADDTAVAGVGVVHGDVADDDPAAYAHGDRIGSAHPFAQPDKEGRVRDVAHGDVGDGDVLQQGTVHRFQRETPAVIEDAVGNGDVFK